MKKDITNESTFGRGPGSTVLIEKPFPGEATKHVNGNYADPDEDDEDDDEEDDLILGDEEELSGDEPEYEVELDDDELDDDDIDDDDMIIDSEDVDDDDDEEDL